MNTAFVLLLRDIIQYTKISEWIWVIGHFSCFPFDYLKYNLIITH